MDGFNPFYYIDSYDYPGWPENRYYDRVTVLPNQELAYYNERDENAWQYDDDIGSYFVTGLCPFFDKYEHLQRRMEKRR